MLGFLPPGTATGADAPSCPAYNAPNTLTLQSGTPQSARLGTPFSDPVQVALANTNGCPLTTPLAGIAVTFAAPGSGPSGVFSSSGANAALVGTDASGSATAPQFTANHLVGGYQLVAASDYGSVSFSLVNTASGVPTTVVRITTAESAAVSTRYAHPLEARVLDATGAPVAGVDVTYTLGSGGGGNGSSPEGPGATFAGGETQATAVTDGTGLATSPLPTANGVAGRFRAAAQASGITDPVTFSLDNLAAKPPVAKVVGRSKLSAAVNRRYAHRLRLKVRSARGVPLQGQTVTFTLGSGGGSGASGGAGTLAAGASFLGGSAESTATTNADGVAVSPQFDANSVAGTFTATATVAGAVDPVTFSLDNLAAKAPRIRPLTNELSATVGGRFRRPLEVKVIAAGGAPLQGQTVSFTLGSGGGGAGGSGAGGSGSTGAGATFAGGSSQATATTDSRGTATSPGVEADTSAGSFTATATIAGSRGAATFRLTNRADAPTVVTAGAATSESASVGTRFAIPLAVTVTDKHGNPVPGALVTFTAPSRGAGGSFAGPHHRRSHRVRLRTNASGIAVAPGFTANHATGGYVVKATVKGATPAAFALVNQPPGL
ncbi:MAG TPA: hypothetical protein VH063_01995 [Gaiellaceae bacterium]|nr:hypothetical protein [Gaiellaceae bacterium]